MPYVITQSCCADASCVYACPVNCIHPAPGEPGFGTTEMLYVDPDSCVGCGACATACPVDAIKPLHALAAGEEAFIGINADYYLNDPHPVRNPMALVPPHRRLADRRPVRVAVIGAGPAGMFAADELLRHPEVSVDVFDRLLTPYGLLRTGVAPDHQRTKQAEHLFRKIEELPGFSYRLGVEVGRDITDVELSHYYDAVIYTVGASTEKTLGVPGEELPGSLSATSFIAWYNGHPDHRDLDVDLDCDRVVVIGNGNVALDVARILTADPEALARTDIADQALAALRASRVEEVVLLGRRGPAQAAFTVPELVGLAALTDIDIVVEADPQLLVGDDPRTRLVRELAERPPRSFRGAIDTDGAGIPRIVLRFCTAPLAITGEHAADGVEVAATRLVAESGVVRAELSEDFDRIEAGLVLRSVGYHGSAVAGLPFDETTGTVPNAGGRVETAIMPGRYVAGWIKRGPRGFIGTNKSCAQETVAAILDDLDAGVLPRPVRTESELVAELRSRGAAPTDLAGWRRIDSEERRRGALRGAARAKVVDQGELRDLARVR